MNHDYIAVVSLVVVLLGTIWSALVVVMIAARRYERLLARLEQVEKESGELKEQQARMKSDFPAARAQMDSVNSEVDEFKAGRLPERMATAEAQIAQLMGGHLPPRPEPYRSPQAPRQTIPRRDDR